VALHKHPLDVNRQGSRTTPPRTLQDEEQHSFASIVKTHQNHEQVSRGHSGANSPKAGHGGVAGAPLRGMDAVSGQHKNQISINKLQGEIVDESLRAYANELAIDAAIEEHKSRHNSVDVVNH